MKTRIALCLGLLLTVGSAVGSASIYSHDQVNDILVTDPQTMVTDVTPEMIVMWKATAASTDYVSPKVPL